MPFAAVHPDRVAALILHEASATWRSSAGSSIATRYREPAPLVTYPRREAGRAPRLRSLPLGGSPGCGRSRDRAVLGFGPSEEAELDRALATVLFTDIVGSTAKVVELGDTGWRDLVERTMRRLAPFPNVTAAGRSTPPATSSSLPSTGRRGRTLCPGGGRGGASARDRDPSGGTYWRGRDDREQGGRHRGQHRRSDRRASSGLRGARLANVKDLVAGSRLEFEDRGEHALRGIPGTWRVHAARPPM